MFDSPMYLAETVLRLCYVTFSEMLGYPGIPGMPAGPPSIPSPGGSSDGAPSHAASGSIGLQGNQTTPQPAHYNIPQLASSYFPTAINNATANR